MRPGLGLIVAALAAAGLGALTLTAGPPGRPATRADHDRLRPGMTRAEVDRILGGAPRDRLGTVAIVWAPRPGARPVSARFGPNQPPVDFFPGATDPGDRPAVWVSRSDLIAVLFDADDRVKATYRSDVHPSDAPTFLRWLASRPAAVRDAFRRL